MKITKSGIVKSNRIWIGTCRSCLSEAEANESEMTHISSDQRDGIPVPHPVRITSVFSCGFACCWPELRKHHGVIFPLITSSYVYTLQGLNWPGSQHDKATNRPATKRPGRRANESQNVSSNGRAAVRFQTGGMGCHSGMGDGNGSEDSEREE